jgi:hypothetical protein
MLRPALAALALARAPDPSDREPQNEAQPMAKKAKRKPVKSDAPPGLYEFCATVITGCVVFGGACLFYAWWLG